MWWQYTVTFAGSLIVALLTVWVATWWSAKRDYRKALENLRAEILTNIRASNLICQWVDENIEALKDGRMVVATCPHLYDSVWMLVRGDLISHDYLIADTVQELYLQITIGNDLLNKVEDLKWGVVSAMTNTKQRRDLVLKATKGIVSSILLPKLEEAKSLLEKKLK